MSFFYSKFALNNLVKNKRFVLPYILSAIFSILSFYILSSLALGKNLDTLERGVSATKQVLAFGVIVIAIFSVIYLFYTYSFLIKRRVKEFGLYSVLGMTKKQIARILALETVFIAVITIAVGLVLGMLLDKLALLGLLKLFSAGVKFGFLITPVAIICTILLFGGIYFLLLLYTIIKISRLKIVNLLKEENKGEREPKARWSLAIIGLALIGYGYFKALTVDSPAKAMVSFFYAVVAVILGTYLVFIAVSIAVLKVMKNNKNFYYKTKNFISVSGLLYRMKRNAVGLANICILSTMVLVTMGTTGALYVGTENSYNLRYPRQIQISGYNSTNEKLGELEQMVNKVAKEEGVEIKDLVSYNFVSLVGKSKGTNFELDRNLSFSSDIKSIVVNRLSDYNKIANKNETLDDGEALIYVDKQGEYEGSNLNIQGINFKIKEKLKTFPASIGTAEAQITETYYVVVKDGITLTEINKKAQEAYVGVTEEGTVDNYVAFNLSDASKENKVLEKIRSTEQEKNIYIEGKAENEIEFKSAYSSFLFIGIFISMIFIVSQVVIMYYKQISEGYEDKNKFEIMSKVGIRDKQIKQSIRSQVLMIFFAPLIVATIHTLVAYPFIKKILNLFLIGNNNIFLISFISTIAIFTVFYTVVYLITSKIYYKIIKENS